MSTPVECPKCGTHMEIFMKESLAPYSMTITMHPNEGRMISAETISRTLFAWSKALKAAGIAVGHETEVYFTDAHVSDDMSVSLTVSAIPSRRAEDDGSAA